MSNKTLIIIISLIIVVCAGLAGAYYFKQTRPLVVSEEDIQKAQNQQSPTPSPEPTPMAQNDCKNNFDQNKLTNDKVAIAGRQVEVDVKDFGKIVLEFYDKDAPKAVENFLRLTNAGYYDCITFHRVAKNFVIQGGDPSGTGGGGQSAFGKAFEDELNPNAESYKAGYVKGVLAMANSGPNTNGSQFFIMLADVPLPNSYTIFGKVVSGLDVVDKIGQVQITPQMGPTDGAPVTPVVMQSVKIIN